MVDKLNGYHPLMKSENVIDANNDAKAMLDACLLLLHTQKAPSSPEKVIREKTLNAIKVDNLSEIASIKQEMLIGLWEKNHGEKNDESQDEHRAVPWETQPRKNRDGYWVRAEDDLAVLYYADGYSDYIYNTDEGWKDCKFQSKLGNDADYDKISEADALEYAWYFEYNIRRFFSPRPWETRKREGD